MSADPSPSTPRQPTDGGGVAPLVAYGMLLLATLFWAGNFIVGRAVHVEVPPIGLGFWRWIIALALLAPFTARETLGNLAFVLRHWRIFLPLGVTGIAVFNTSAYIALNSTEAINAALIVSAGPVIIVLLSWLFLGERVTRRQAAGVVVSLAGAVTLVTRGTPSAVLALELNPGDFWMLVAVTDWAVYSVLLRRCPPGLTAPGLLTVLIVIGLVPLLPAYLWAASTGRVMEVSPVTVLSVGYAALFASIGAYFCWNGAVSAVGARRAELLLNMMPVFSTVLAILLLGESVKTYHLAGIVPIFVGIYLATRRGRGDPTRRAQ